MNTVPNESTCPKCGQPVSLNAFEGLCPACLLQAGFGTVTGDPGAEKLSAFVPPTPEELAKHFPQLEIIELLGRGGMGAVYKARQVHLDRIVALKILPPAVSQAPAFAERFIREARALAKLHHPNIVTLYESGQADDLFFFLMEFVDGVNLRQLLSTGTISARDALAIVPQICDALQFAHDRGIVHRDIKPENILLSKTGQVKIADFGVAKIVAGEMAEVPSAIASPQENSQTEIGKILGTPQYMAPEQISHPLDVDNRADIYALGVVFYQMLTGELPAGKFEPPSHKVQIDVRLDEIVLRALAKQPDLRYQQASVMKTHVETIAHAPSIPVPPGIPFSSPPAFQKEAEVSYPPRVSRMAIFGATLLPFCLIVAGFLFLLTHAYHPDSRGLTLVSTLFLFLCLGVIFGTTILGWIAVFRIRHSDGKLSGLKLAIFDGLLFPLLFLDALLGSVVNGVVNTVGDSLGLSLLQTTIASSPTMTLTQPTLLGRLFVDHRPELVQVVSLVLAVIVDWFIIRWIWRAVNKSPYQLPSKSTIPTSPPNGTFRFFPVLRWFLVVFSVFILTVLGGAYVTFGVLPKIYTATAQIQVHPRGDSHSNTSAAFDATAFQAEFETILSPTVLLPVIKDLNLDQIWAKRSLKTPSDILPPLDALAYLQKNLRIAQPPGTKIIDITASSDHPQEAADIANAIADRYKTLRSVQEDQRRSGASQSARLRDQIAQQQKVVDEKLSALISEDGAARSHGATFPSPTMSESDINLLIAREKELHAAQLDSDARQIMLKGILSLPDDQFLAVLKALGQNVPSEPAHLLTPAQIDGLRRTIQIDADMAQSRIAVLQKQVNDLKAQFPEAESTQIALESDLQVDQRELLAAKEDSDARRVLLQSVNNLPDDQLVSTLKGLGRDPKLASDPAHPNPAEVTALRRALQLDAEMAQSRAKLLQKRVDALKKQIAATLPSALVPVRKAQRDYTEQKNILDALNIRLKQVLADQQLLEPPVRIISRASPPAYPSQPNTRLNLLLSALAGILLGLLVASALELILWLRRSSVASPQAVAPPQRHLRKFLFYSLPIALVLAFVARTFFLQPFQIETDTASPEIPRDSHVLVWKLTRQFTPGDFVVYRQTGGTSVGRVASSTSESVFINRNGEDAITVASGAVLGKVVSVLWRASTSAIPPSSISTKTPPQVLTFGPEAQGLQAALELKPARTTFKLGEPIDILFHFHNVSTKNIFLAGGSWRQDDAQAITITDEQGQKIPIVHIWYSGITPIQRTLLSPGETTVFHSSGLAFISEDPDERKVTHPVGNYVKVKPGRYTITYRLHFPDLFQGTTPEEEDWQGDLETAPVTVNIEAPAIASTQSPSFGPIIERLIETKGTNHRALNLTSGNFMEPSRDQAFVFNADGADTLRKAGVDLYTGDTTMAPDNLNSLDFRFCSQLTPQGKDRPITLDDLTPDQFALLLAQMEKFQSTLTATGVFGGTAGFDLTKTEPDLRGTGPYLFVTRDGTAGLLQITGLNAQPPGVIIRYKLLAHP